MVLANWPITCRMPPRQLRLHTLRLSALPFFRSLLHEGDDSSIPARLAQLRTA